MKSNRRADIHYSSLDVSRANDLFRAARPAAEGGRVSNDTILDLAAHLGATAIENIFPKGVALDASKVLIHPALPNFTPAEAEDATRRRISSL